MSTIDVVLIALAAVSIFVVLPWRRSALRRGSGPLAQMEFKRRHGDELVRLLGAGVPVDTLPRSPWTNIQLDDRAARIVVARLTPERLQVGVDLSEWRIPVEIWLTDGSTHELDVPDDISYDDVLEIVRELRELGVDNVATNQAGSLVRHIMRVQFTRIDELPALLARIAPHLRRLEQLAPPGSDDDVPAESPTLS
ncbi:MAG: hypothetical protein H7287_08270 [Thermoleophilia bacterium]|nr:hypothetical protein [Thermoleophilia bacterium]